MKRYVENKCEICESLFKVAYKKRSQKTCGKTCSYKLRIIVRHKIKHKPVEKICNQCKSEFKDTSKKKLVKKCKTCINKNMVETRRKKGSYSRSDEQNKKLSNTMKKKYESGWNPNTEEHRLKMSKFMKDRWESGEMKQKTQETCIKKYGVEHWTKSDKGRIKISKIHSGRVHTKKAKFNMSKGAQKRVRENNNLYTRGKGGYREDIGFYVRSNWEANFARILILEEKDFIYEPKSFQLTSCISYTPDFLVGDILYEVKGFMDEISSLKIALFREKYPDKELKIIDGNEYNDLRNKYKSLIKWEGK